LAALLVNKPLARDEENGDDWDPLGLRAEEEDETWQKAAWHGWQYLSLRGARKWAPRSTSALLDATCGRTGPGA